MTPDTYHHGSLKESSLRAAAELVAAKGVEALTLRELARHLGVSHAAPAHHFGDRKGLLTALAAEGFRILTGQLDEAGDDFLDVAVAYVRFATLTHRGHYAVMFLGTELNASDPELIAAREAASEVLQHGLTRVKVRSDDPADVAYAPLAALSLVHGLASLWNSGAIAGSSASDDPAGSFSSDSPDDLTRHLGRILFSSR